MILCPPWRFHVYTAENEIYQPGPYALIFTSPGEPRNSYQMTYADGTYHYSRGELLQSWKSEIDGVRLLLHIFIVALGTSGLIITFREKKPTTH
jgi:hypothetical protein